MLNKKNSFFFNRCKWLAAILVLSQTLRSQQSYFQQEVKYKIAVTLDDKKHFLSAFEEIQYINNSEQGLEIIYFHLWPNAYKNNHSALAKQMLQHGKKSLHFAKDEDLGFIDSLDFAVNGKKVKWEYDKEHEDICKIILNEPLRSLDTILISTPFRVKIPDARFSRLGHTGQAYFITQWYPKPAVYDSKGWHPMPYLDQGEFYSEFGSFDVSITLPDNYVLAATGDRIDASIEEVFLNNNVKYTIDRLQKNDFRKEEMAFPPSSLSMKTVRFKQYRVHDFAWFADKRFNVLHDQIELPNTHRIVDTWVFFTNKNFELWKDAIHYVNESTLFYSYLIGDYPYNNITAIDGTIMAGGGMEYPNITVIGDAGNPYELDITITHEVGHNWFYGVLGSNEREYPALDEGINSLYELRYARAKYPHRKLIEYIGRDSTFSLFGANKIAAWREKEVAYFFSARSRTDQPINANAAAFTALNYGSIVYAKTAIAFDYLMDYMGEENFDKAMQFYFDNFKFKHPNISDLEKTLSHFSNKNLNWFFSHLYSGTEKIDYKIRSQKRNNDGSYTLKIKNKTNTPVPFNIYALSNGKSSGFIWIDGFEGTRLISFPSIEANKFKIDGQDRMPDLNRKNNYIHANGYYQKRKPIRFRFITGFENPEERQLNYLPMVGGNYYNGMMLGVALHNYGMFQKKFEFYLAPLFAFKTKSPVGFAEFNYKIYPTAVFRQIAIGSKLKSFSYDYYNSKYLNQTLNTSFSNLFFNYYRIAPYIEFEFKKKVATSSISQFISYSNNNIWIEESNPESFKTFAVTGPQKKDEFYFVNELQYLLTNKHILYPHQLNVSLQHNGQMAKLFASFSQQIALTKKHYFSFRLFGGSFIAGNEFDKGRYAFRMSGYNGYHDYLFSENFIARNETSGLGFSQFSEQDGAMKIWTPLGQSTEWLVAANIKSPRLFVLPVRLYFDLATCDPRSLNSEKVLWAGGLNFTLLKDIVEVYLPLGYSSDIAKTLELNNISFWNRVRFTMNLHKLAPKNIIRDNFF